MGLTLLYSTFSLSFLRRRYRPLFFTSINRIVTFITRRWIGTIEGPKDTIYENLKFKLTLDFTAKYPYVAPVVQFITTCFHPNVDSEGNICLDILKVRIVSSNAMPGRSCYIRRSSSTAVTPGRLLP